MATVATVVVAPVARRVPAERAAREAGASIRPAQAQMDRSSMGEPAATATPLNLVAMAPPVVVAAAGITAEAGEELASHFLSAAKAALAAAAVAAPLILSPMLSVSTDGRAGKKHLVTAWSCSVGSRDFVNALCPWRRRSSFR